MNARDVPGDDPAYPTRLFVYGTLRRGGGAEDLLQSCTFLGEATISGSLYDLGPYPALVLDDAGEVSGEVWSCDADTLATLDSYEGVDAGLFRRVRVRAGDHDCWTYEAGRRIRAQLRPASRIESGRWQPRH